MHVGTNGCRCGVNDRKPVERAEDWVYDSAMSSEHSETLATARDLKSISRYGLFERVVTLAPPEGWGQEINHQPYDRQNPFDRDSKAGDPILEIVLDTPSFADQLTSDGPKDPALSRVLQLAGLRFLQVIALPTDVPAITQFLTGHGVLVAKDGDFGMLVVRGKTDDGTFSKAFNETDIVVTQDPTTDTTDVPRSLWRSSPGETLELVRLVLLSKSMFEVAPGFSVDDTLYRTYQRWKSFPELQEPWSIAAYCHDEASFPKGLFEHLGSLCRRQELLCRAADECHIHARRPRGNHEATLTLYHFAYFVMLATGLFDDLAWSAYKFHEIEPKYKTHVDLRRPGFRDSLQRKNPSLRHYLNQGHVQNLLRLFYPIRDRLQHRLFIGKVVVGDLRTERDVLQLPDGTLDLIDEQPGKEPRKKWGVLKLGDEHYVEADRFVSTALEAIRDLHREFVCKIPWTRDLKDAPVWKREEIAELRTLFNESIWRYSGFGREPVYF